MTESQRVLPELKAVQATQADIESVLALYAQVGEWLHDIKGIADQWPRQWGRGLVERLIEAEVMFIFFSQKTMIGACILSDRQEPAWDTFTENALYLHGLATRCDMADREFGQAILQWAEQTTREQGKIFLRLDCVASNEVLRRYYSNCGFTELKVVEEPEPLALFEKKV